jgi:hypothetical protein
MLYRILALFVVLAVVSALPGCGDDRVVVIREGGDPGLVQGGINPGDTSFELVVGQASGGGGWFPGPFVIRGENIYYDHGIGALMVDLTVANHSPNTYPLPVRLEFVALLPTNVTVLNPDNDIHGPGAMIDFHFANRDLNWDPGEVSLPRNVQFGVRPGVSIGFGARIHVGPSPELGRISGSVWHDVNQNGWREPDEFGLAAREITLAYADSMFDCLATDCIIVKRTRTDIVGEYSFVDLDAGYYLVSMVRDRCSNPTTPTELQVILVNENGTVSDFPYADFGVALMRNCCGIVNGDFSGGEFGWENHNHGPGVGAGVEEIVDLGERKHVLRLDSRAGSDYYLQRAQITASCGVVGYSLLWDWMIEPEQARGLGAVIIDFIDGAHNVLGRYFVHRHTGHFEEYTCDNLIRRHLEENPRMFVGCEEIHATFAAWGTHRVDFSQDFFNRLPGPDVNPSTIAEIRVWIQSFNNDGSGADAYFDNFRYGHPNPK